MPSAKYKHLQPKLTKSGKRLPPGRILKALCAFLQQPSRKKGGSQPATQQKKVGGDEPDIGLSGSHEFVKFLGRGGTGDTHLYIDRASGEEVAIKLVKRPVPKLVQPNLLREIRVSVFMLSTTYIQSFEVA